MAYGSPKVTWKYFFFSLSRSHDLKFEGTTYIYKSWEQLTRRRNDIISRGNDLGFKVTVVETTYKSWKRFLSRGNDFLSQRERLRFLIVEMTLIIACHLRGSVKANTYYPLNIVISARLQHIYIAWMLQCLCVPCSGAGRMCVWCLPVLCDYWLE